MSYKNLVKETTTTTGTGPFVRGGAVAGFRAFTPAYAIGDEVPYCARMGAQFEFGKGLVTATTIERTTVTDSSNGGALVPFTAGTKDLFVAVAADFLNGQTIGDLATAGSIPDTYVLEVYDPATGLSLKATVAALRPIFGGAAQPADTTGPTFPDSLTSSSVTQTGFTFGWAAGSDANGIAKYEYSFDGTTWTSAGTALSVAITGRTAATAYTMRARAVDPAGNPSTVRTLIVTTAAAAGGTNAAPTMSGSLTTTNVSSSGYTMNWAAGADDVGVVAYETSIDGGTSWLDVGTVLARVVTGRTAATTDNLRVRARDAGGLYSNVLSATVTTSAAAVVAYEITGQGTTPNAVKSTFDASAIGLTSGKKGITSSNAFTNGNGYFNITPTPASAHSGWSMSNTVPPDILSPETLNTTGGTGNSVNGAIAMTKPAAWSNNARIWVTSGAGTVGPFYFWVKPVDGAWFCFNAGSGLTITGA